MTEWSQLQRIHSPDGEPARSPGVDRDTSLSAFRINQTNAQTQYQPTSKPGFNKQSIMRRYLSRLQASGSSKVRHAQGVICYCPISCQRCLPASAGLPGLKYVASLARSPQDKHAGNGVQCEGNINVVFSEGAKCNFQLRSICATCQNQPPRMCHSHQAAGAQQTFCSSRLWR